MHMSGKFLVPSTSGRQIKASVAEVWRALRSGVRTEKQHEKEE